MNNRYDLDALRALLDDNAIDVEVSLTRDLTLMQLGIDSFNMTVLADSLSEIEGRDLRLLPTDTVGDILDRINHGD